MRGKLVPVKRPPEIADQPARAAGPAMFDGGVLLGRVHAEQSLNWQHAGVPQVLLARDFPLALAASSTAYTTFDVDDGDYYAVAGVHQAWRTDATNNTVPSSRYAIEVKLRDLTDGRREITDGWVPAACLFGSGRRPGPFRTPMVLPAGTRIEVEVRNSEAVPLAAFFHLICTVKEAGSR